MTQISFQVASVSDAVATLRQALGDKFVNDNLYVIGLVLDRVAFAEFERGRAGIAASPATSADHTRLLEAAYQVVDWRHEWNEHPLEMEAVKAFDALEEAVGDWTP